MGAAFRPRLATARVSTVFSFRTDGDLLAGHNQPSSADNGRHPNLRPGKPRGAWRELEDGPRPALWELVNPS